MLELASPRERGTDGTRLPSRDAGRFFELMAALSMASNYALCNAIQTKCVRAFRSAPYLGPSAAALFWRAARPPADSAPAVPAHAPPHWQLELRALFQGAIARALPVPPSFPPGLPKPSLKGPSDGLVARKFGRRMSQKGRVRPIDSGR